MTNAMKERIVVEAKSKWGVLVEGKWRNFADLKLLAGMKVGKAYDVEEGKDAKNRSVITKATEIELDGPPAAEEKTNDKKEAANVAPKAAAPAATSKPSDKGLSFAEKDSRILVQGLTQAVIQSNLVAEVDDVEPVVVALIAMVLRLSGTK